MKNLKKWIAALLVLAITLLAATALAAGNVTIAIQGRNGFDMYVQNMFVAGNRLILLGGNEMYMWAEETGLVRAEGYDVDIELQADEHLVMDDVYAIDGRIWRRATIESADGFEKMLLVEIVIGDDGKVSAGEVVDIGDAFIRDYGDGIYSPESAFSVDGVLYGLTYLDGGRALVAFDIQSGESDVTPLEFGDGQLQPVGMTAFDEGRALLLGFDYSQTCKLFVYDLGSGKMTELGDLPVVNYDPPCAPCYDSERGKMYYCLDGSVWRMDVTENGMGEAEAFGDMPLDIYLSSIGVLLGDTYILSSGEGVVGRDVTAEQMPPENLAIESDISTDSLLAPYFDFTEAHPEYTVTVQKPDDTQDAVVQAMLSRATDVDIYTMYADDRTAFLTLLSRGYMADLGESEKLTALVDTLYPFLQALAMPGGELCAVPLNMGLGGFGYNRTLLVETFGYSEGELPTSWEGLFALIADLAENDRMKDAPEVSLLDPYMTERGAKATLFMQMMQDYLLWLDDDPANLAQGNETLLRLCEAFEQVDWSKLGFIGEGEEPVYDSYSSDTMILDMHTAFGLTGNRDRGWIAQPLSLLEGGEPMLGTAVQMAFVNPFSTHREAAIEYLEALTARIDQRILMGMSPTRNDPIENSRYEEVLKDYDDDIAADEELLAKAEAEGDDETIAAVTRSLEDTKQRREDYATNRRYEVSPEDIQAYRDFAGSLRAIRSTTTTYRSDSITQYLDGAIDKEQFVREMDRIITMRKQEAM